MQPFNQQLGSYLGSKGHLQREFGMAECWPFVFVEVATHVQVKSSKIDMPNLPTAFGRAFWRYTPDEVASMQEDPTKRQRYVETYRDVLIPRLQAIKNILRTQAHILSPSADLFDNDFGRMFEKFYESTLGMTRIEFCNGNPRTFFNSNCEV